MFAEKKGLTVLVVLVQWRHSSGTKTLGMSYFIPRVYTAVMAPCLEVGNT